MSSPAHNLLAKFGEIDRNTHSAPPLHQLRTLGYRNLDDIINGIPDGSLPPLSLFDGDASLLDDEKLIVLAKGSV